uniref:Uncharacterized protein n=1 Tax=Siphoviridae sp. ct4Am4 TaxID=2826287 RepID=A0A8S5R299_9CAUD|nr:MAG TPA: hypothetical protein [Siphoviridae sp. ct4Am4]
MIASTIAFSSALVSPSSTIHSGVHNANIRFTSFMCSPPFFFYHMPIFEEYTIK